MWTSRDRSHGNAGRKNKNQDRAISYLLTEHRKQDSVHDAGSSSDFHTYSTGKENLFCYGSKRFNVPCSRVLPYNFTVAHFVNKSSVFYGIRVFIYVFTRARHCSLSWVILTHTISYHKISVKFRFNIILQTVYHRVVSSLHILRLNLCMYFLACPFQLPWFQKLS